MASPAPPASGSPDLKFLVQVQWLRAIAAIMVMLHHANYFADLLGERLGWPPAKLLGVPFWWFGVHIFFVISGFLMVRTATGFGERGAPRRFLMRRLIRIVPLYWLLTTVSVAIMIVSPQSIAIATDKVQYVVSSYLFIPVLRAPGDLRPILGQGWTLVYEMYFYVLFALAMVLPRRLGLAALTILFLVLTFVGRDATVETPVLFTWTDGIILEFLFGCVLALAHERGLRLPASLAVGAVVSSIFLLFMEFQGPSALVAGIPALLFVGGFVLGPRPREGLASRWLALVGDASYSLYLTHIFVLRAVYEVWRKLPVHAVTVALYPLAGSLAAILASLVVYRLVEKPMTVALLNRFRDSDPNRTLRALFVRTSRP